MEKQTFILWVMISVFLPACTFSPMIGVEGDFQLTVAHMNDTHSFIEPALLKVTPMGEDAFTVETSDIARTVTKVAQLRSEHPNLLFLHAGDMTQGSFYSMRYHGDSDLFFFNLMELDGMVTGNHEFDHGPEKLSEFISKAQFPFLVANIESQEDAYLQNSFFPYKIKYLNNEPVGIIGLVTKEVAEISSPGK
ncbi:MAG: metallophosphoesterase, partial [Desulfobulbaceae bacterium]|nr:metallophosphoesterase [Desulfobulbaceae bacterium]